MRVGCGRAQRACDWGVWEGFIFRFCCKWRCAPPVVVRSAVVVRGN